MSAPSCPARLVDLAHRRWTMPLLVELHAASRAGDPTGARMVGLCRRLGVGRESLRQTLDFAISRGWVRRNPGHGHPLRPEFLLRPAGAALAPACGAVLNAAAALGLEDELSRKWSAPVVRVLAEGPARFGEIRDALADHGATDRSLSLTLGVLLRGGLLSRRVASGRPPTVVYAVSPRGAALARAVRAL